MSNVVILAVNARYVHTSLSAWVLAKAVAAHARIPHRVEVVESHIGLGAEEIARRAAALSPDLVGISTYIWNAGLLPELAEKLRACLPGVLLVFGGPEAAHNPSHWLGHADYILRGEGEAAFPALLDRLALGEDLSGLPGLCLRENGAVRQNPEGPPLTHPVDPYTPEYLAALDGRIAYLETSRGCPFSCAFCLSGGSGVRFFPLEAAKEQMRALSKSGARTIKLVDRTFNCDARRAYALFEFVIGLDCDCCFHFEVAPDLFDRATLALLKTAPPGRIQLEAGLQSFFLPALEAAARKTDLVRAEENIREILAGGNVHLHLDLIAGLPYETLPRFMDSFDRAFALGGHTLQLGFLKLLRGSALREAGWEISASPHPPYEITGSRWLSAGDLEVLGFAAHATSQTYNKGRFLGTLKYLLAVSGLRPFALFEGLGRASPGHHVGLGDYAKQLYDCAQVLPGVEPDKLRGEMLRDYLATVKGAGLPAFLRGEAAGRRGVAAFAKKALGREIRRDEAAVLPDGRGIFVDSQTRDPVTGLYKLWEFE